MRTFAIVSGNRSATRPPPTSTDEAMRMGIAFVMPTRDPKIRFPNTADSLHRALQNPKPVPLWREKWRRGEKYVLGSLNQCFICYITCMFNICNSMNHTLLASMCFSAVPPDLLTVGNDSVVTTSREFQAEMLRPL